MPGALLINCSSSALQLQVVYGYRPRIELLITFTFLSGCNFAFRVHQKPRSDQNLLPCFHLFRLTLVHLHSFSLQLIWYIPVHDVYTATVQFIWHIGTHDPTHCTTPYLGFLNCQHHPVTRLMFHSVKYSSFALLDRRFCRVFRIELCLSEQSNVLHENI